MKGLEALKSLFCYLPTDKMKWASDDYNIIEKELKALKIIKEKKVNVGDFVRTHNVEQYNDYCTYTEKEQLTQEEYELLKEVLL